MTLQVISSLAHLQQYCLRQNTLTFFLEWMSYLILRGNNLFFCAFNVLNRRPAQEDFLLAQIYLALSLFYNERK